MLKNEVILPGVRNARELGGILDERYGGVSGYLNEELGIGAVEIKYLREKYLE